MSKIRFKNRFGSFNNWVTFKSNGRCLIYCVGPLFFYAAAPDASGDQFERLSVFSETELTYKMTSAETELTLTPNRENGKVNRTKVELLCGVPASFCKFRTFLSCPPGVTGTNEVQDEPTVQIYLPSDLRPAGIKDVVRNFIREAKMVCAFPVSVWFFPS